VSENTELRKIFGSRGKNNRSLEKTSYKASGIVFLIKYYYNNELKNMECKQYEANMEEKCIQVFFLSENVIRTETIQNTYE
jgi:hypothetical protein